MRLLSTKQSRKEQPLAKLAAGKVYDNLKERKSFGLGDNNLAKFHSNYSKWLKQMKSEQEKEYSPERVGTTRNIALKQIDIRIRVHKPTINEHISSSSVTSRTKQKMLNSARKVHNSKKLLGNLNISTSCSSVESSFMSSAVSSKVPKSTKMIPDSPIRITRSKLKSAHNILSIVS